MAEQSDFSELRQFAADLDDAPNVVAPKIHGVLRKGAMNIKEQLRSEAGRSKYFKGIVPSITFSSKIRKDDAEVEIGPDKKVKGGGLANIAYFGGLGWKGSVHTGGTLPDPQGALDAEAPEIEKFISDILGEAI